MKYRNDKLKIWLIMVTIVLSFSAFSEWDSNSTLLSTNKAQTELVSSVVTKGDKFTVAFKKVTFACPRHRFSNRSCSQLKTLLLTYNILVKVKFDNISKLYQLTVQAHQFLQLKIIPGNSGEDIFSTIG